jgi:hypothetical protein
MSSTHGPVLVDQSIGHTCRVIATNGVLDVTCLPTSEIPSHKASLVAVLLGQSLTGGDDMDATTRYYLVLTAVFAALGAVTSFALAWQLRDRSPKGPPTV